MTKTIAFICLIFMFSACGDAKTEKTPAPAVAEAPSEGARGLEIISASDCTGCHMATQRIQGPTYTEIAMKYKGKSYAMDSIMHQIKNGGVGKWGSIKMLPHPQFNDEDLKQMAIYIMSLAK